MTSKDFELMVRSEVVEKIVADDSGAGRWVSIPKTQIFTVCNHCRRELGMRQLKYDFAELLATHCHQRPVLVKRSQLERV